MRTTTVDRSPLPTVAASVTQEVLAVAVEAGVGAEVRRRTGLPVELDAAGRIPDDTHLAVWETAMQACNDGSLPIRVAERMRLESHGVLGHACRTAATLEEALTRLARYTACLAEAVECTVEVRDGHAFLEVRRAGRGIGHHASIESTVAEIWSAIRQIVDDDILVEVWHRHEPLGDLRRHRAFYGCPVRFGCDCDALVLDADALVRPLPLADDALSEYFLMQLEELTPPTTWRGRVSDEIERALSTGTPSLPDAARSLGVSPRTLQRQLSAEGTSFQELVAETRCRLAEALLGDGLHSISEVAFLLGFSEPSAFHRAFRRWTGVTPAVLAKAS